MTQPTTWHHTTTWDPATDLANQLAQGHDLPIIETTLLLDPDEVAHAEVTADCWWYGEINVPYQHQQFTAFGGLGLLALTATASAIGNHWRRTTARRLAAPRWRHLGHGPVILTSDRTLIDLEGEWMTLWHDDLLQATPNPARQQLQLTLDDGTPYALQGPWVPYLTVVLSHLFQAGAQRCSRLNSTD